MTALDFQSYSTAKVEVTATAPTADVPGYTSVAGSVSESYVQEIIEDGLAIQAEIARYAARPSHTFALLDDGDAAAG